MQKPRKLRLSEAETALRAKLSGARVHAFGPIPEDANEFRRQMCVVAEELGVTSPWGQPEPTPARRAA